MKLKLDVPPSWVRRRDGVREVALVPGDPAGPAAALVWTPLEILADEPRAWVAAELRTGVADATAAVDVLADHHEETTTGWPVRLVETVVRARPGAPITEWRLTAFYVFLEHATTAMLRTTTEPRYRESLALVRPLLLAAIPDWSGEVACLAEVWDLATVPRPRATTLRSAPPSAPDPRREPLAPVEESAIAEWEATAAAHPTEVDALYNVGLAHYRLGNPAAALGAWERALARRPRDFWLLRKQVQALHALGRHDDARAVRAVLVDVFRTDPDPAVHLQNEFVFDQLTLPDRPGIRVLAYETLQPRDVTAYALYRFRLIDEHDPVAPPLEVAVETSDYARSRGVAFVVSVLDDTRYQVVAQWPTLPAYAEITATVLSLVTTALATRSRHHGDR